MTNIPNIESKLRHNILKLPEEIRRASGIIINGKRIKSSIFSTDLAIIRNCDADSTFAVYPFSPQMSISDAIIKVSSMPVFCGIGGGTTNGHRIIGLAKDAEAYGAVGVVLNSPISNEDLYNVARVVDIPVVVTVVNDKTDIKARIDAGASILNVAGAEKTADIVKKIRYEFPETPIIASGGPASETILKTIEAGANMITYTPPSTKELFKTMMTKYRNQI